MAAVEATGEFVNYGFGIAKSADLLVVRWTAQLATTSELDIARFVDGAAGIADAVEAQVTGGDAW